MMKNSFKKHLCLAAALAVGLLLSVRPLVAQSDFVPAMIKDISGRAYEPEVVKLLDGAKESIVISMYSISLGTGKKNPVALLINDLLEARGRGVSVTLYLNTKFGRVNKESRPLIGNPLFNKLKEAGCVIYLMPPNRRLHDKLLVIDSRYVVEGSVNWSVSALRDNFESAVLIDSPALAKQKLLRFNTFPRGADTVRDEPPKPVYAENIPENLSIPEGLILEKGYFPKMLTRRDTRSADLYLLLLAHGLNAGKREFFIDMEAMALSLRMPDAWSASALRRQVIRSLKRLKNDYGLIRVKFFFGKDAWVELADISGKAFTISSEIIKSKDLSARARFYLMAQALFESNGEDISTVSAGDLGKRLHVHQTTISEARRDLKKPEKPGTAPIFGQ